MTTQKSTIADLAILGGRPAFSDQLYVNRPNTPDRKAFLDRVEGMLDRRWFTNKGPLVVELEEELARYLAVEHCVLTCNGTVALDLASRALGLKGEVIVPSFTFVATAHALLWQGIQPVFCDIDPQSWNIDPVACESLITERTTGILGVHLWGRPCDNRSLVEIAARHDLRLFFDAAHAFGCTYQGSMIGGGGDAEVFSFHATKVFHTLEGGAVTTNDPEVADRVRLMRNFGFTGYDEVAVLGTNAKMSEASAAMGLSNLECIEQFIATNRGTFEAYLEGLGQTRGLELLRYDEGERHNYQYVVLDVAEDRLGLSRDQLMHVLQAENVLARRYFYPGCHRMAPYASRWPEADGSLPHTNRAARGALVLPAGAGVTLEQVREICGILRLVADQAAQVRSALESDGSEGSHAVIAPARRVLPSQ